MWKPGLQELAFTTFSIWFKVSKYLVTLLTTSVYLDANCVSTVSIKITSFFVASQLIILRPRVQTEDQCEGLINILTPSLHNVYTV